MAHLSKHTLCTQHLHFGSVFAVFWVQIWDCVLAFHLGILVHPSCLPTTCFSLPCFLLYWGLEGLGTHHYMCCFQLEFLKNDLRCTLGAKDSDVALAFLVCLSLESSQATCPHLHEISHPTYRLEHKLDKQDCFCSAVDTYNVHNMCSQCVDFI